MNISEDPNRRWPARKSRGSSRTVILLAAAAIVVVLIAVLRGPGRRLSTSDSTTASQGAAENQGGSSSGGRLEGGRAKPRLASQGGGGGNRTPEAIVAGKSAEFAQGRRKIAEAMARHFNVQISPEVDRFFTAAESGDWADIKGLFNALSTMKESADGKADLGVLWPAIFEAYGVAEAVRVWPAQELLEYGEAVLGSLKPGSIYLGGSDAGRYIPTLLNETSGEGRNVMLTQSSLSDMSYLNYMSFLYADRMTVPTRTDAEQAMNTYLQEAVERKNANQLGPNEQVVVDNGRINVAGQGAVMSINEKILLALMEKNPAMSFAVEEAFPMSGLHAAATPVGPILEIRGGDAGGPLSPEQASQTVQYWSQTAERLQSLPESDALDASRRAYAQMAVSQANVLAARSRGAEAEQAYRIAMQMTPTSVEPLGALVDYLQKAGRAAEAQQAVAQYINQYPNNAGIAEAIQRRMLPPKP